MILRVLRVSTLHDFHVKVHLYTRENTTFLAADDENVSSTKKKNTQRDSYTHVCIVLLL